MRTWIWKGRRHIGAHFRKWWWLQVAALIAIWFLSDALVRKLHLPIPGSVMGLFLLLLALELGLVPVTWFRRGAAGLLAHLILFLAPAMLAIVNHGELLSMIGVKLLAAVLIGTPLVMASTAMIVEIGFRLQARREH
ncbi:MAG TPA: CidA/LrgA family protein [Chthoniobacterales bacterium]